MNEYMIKLFERNIIEKITILSLSAIIHNHLMKLDSHWKPSAYPTLFITEHINTSMGLAPGFFCFESFPYV